MRVILVERRLTHEPTRLQELTALTRTLGHEVVTRIEQIRRPDPAYQIGKGKVKEVAELVKSREAERVIFANPLKPSQVFKLENLIGVEVIDRFQLILEIFAMRAGTPEAKLQVEYARLSYELPRVKERVRRSKLIEQPGLRGPGEYEVSVHHDTIKRRMNNLKRKLASIGKTRGQRRKLRRRRGFDLVAIAGYTNAGKSTLLNRLTSSNVAVDNMLFTTLSPRTRAVKTGSRKVLLTDTVGFIDGLPPWLVESFKATLEEIFLADLVLLIVDISEPIQEILRKLRASREVLAEYPVKIITLLNKIDLVSEAELTRRMEVLRTIEQEVIPISAGEGTNLNQLLEVLRSYFLKRLQVRLTTRRREGVQKLLHELHEEAAVQDIKFESPMQVVFWTDERTLGRLKQTFGRSTKLEILGGPSA
ncbi:MAG: GTPase HflX [Candidatus Hadarchaeota archaeon]|nr:GTPase HflX [Candidatus Hadarchaeota archaeon]